MGKRSRRQRRRRAIRITLGVSFVVAVVVLLAAAASYQDLSQIRNSLNATRSALTAAIDDPTSLRTHDGRVAAVTKLDEAIANADVARSRLRASKPLGILRFVPVLRRQRNGLAALVYDTQKASIAGRRLVTESDRLANVNFLEGGNIPLDAVGRLADEVSAAGIALTSVSRPSAGLWGPLRSARQTFDDVVGPTGSRLTGSGDSLRAARTFMGANGPRRYLVAVENNDEMRDRGMVLSYAVATFDRGHLAVERHGSINDLTLHDPVPEPLDAGRAAIFGNLEPTKLWESVNAPADFGWSARTMSAMYTQASGEHVDGVISLDVPGLAYALRATGPVAVESLAAPVSADNASALLLKQLYDQDPSGSQRARHEILDKVAVAIIQKLTTTRQDAIALGRELGEAAAENRFRLWSATPAEEAVFERTGLGGGPAASALADRTFHTSIQNGTATKLDYFVKASMAVDVTITQGGSAVVRTRLTLTNTAPKGARPSYQLGPDPYGTTRSPGDYIGRIYYYSPRGSVTLDSVEESSLVLHTDVVRLSPGESKTVLSQAVIPDAVRHGRLDLRMVPQPRLDPVDLTVHLSAPGRRPPPPPHVHQSLTKTLVLSWPIG
jgi:hypothetical protein